MRNLIFTVFVLTLVLCASILGACNFCPKTAVFSLPENLFSESEEITLFLTGRQAEEEVYVFSRGEKIELPVKENIPLAINIKSSSYQNYGAVYPFQTEVSLKNGFASSILRILYNGALEKEDFSLIQLYLSSFNWQRFLNVLESKEDVWQLDRQLIIDSIAENNFSLNKIKVLSP